MPKDEVSFDYEEDVLALVELVETIKSDADIHGQFLGNTCVADAKSAVVQNIEDANEVNWEPLPEQEHPYMAKFNTDEPSVNEEEYFPTVELSA